MDGVHDRPGFQPQLQRLVTEREKDSLRETTQLPHRQDGENNNVSQVSHEVCHDVRKGPVEIPATERVLNKEELLSSGLE